MIRNFWGKYIKLVFNQWPIRITKILVKFISKIDGGKSEAKILDFYIRVKSIRPKETFSQFGEDAVLSFFLHEKRGGYLDVGAGHFRNGSNSFAFYRRGWRGLCVEPIPKFYELLKKKRPGDKVIQKVVSNIPKKVEFFEYDPYEISTTDPTTVKLLGKLGTSPIRSWEVDSISINDLGISVKPNQPYFLTIDCEGLDIEIIKSINFQKLCPRVICCEIHPVNKEGRRELEAFLKSNNYRLMAICVFSLIFVHNEYLNAQGWSRYI